MHIGVDFDNTIACYDALFHKVAREKSLIPADVPVNKSDVRNYLRRVDNEAAWTELQGYVYGARMSEAEPYPGVLEFFRTCRSAGLPLSIISHKTRHPFLGEPYDLHATATNWLEQQGFFNAAQIGLPRDHVFFELTKLAKLERIGQRGCTHFIDDLPEFLAEAAFPAGVLRILFDANNHYATEKKFVRVRGWSEARSLFANDLAAPAEANRLHERVSPLVRQHYASGGFILQPLPGGANNRVYRVRGENFDGVLKAYFQNPADPRDRFRAEHAFYELLARHGISRTPEPLGWDTQHHLGLFSFVEGRKLRLDEVDEQAVGQALEFIVAVNRARSAADVGSIPVASEACFSIAEHLATVERRLKRLQNIAPASEIDRAASDFVRDELNPAWKQIHEIISRESGTIVVNELPRSGRCLSPSDFGFHNALLTEDGLKFFDFEYAGWDDPAKLVCDFFCQPELPVDPGLWNEVVGRLAATLNPDPGFVERARRLVPAYQIKWCCILLNDFLASDQTRREFALGKSGAPRQAAQLHKARQALARLRQWG